MMHGIKSRTYIAKRKHKNRCHYCRLPVLVGDEIETSTMADSCQVWTTVSHLICVKGIKPEAMEEFHDDPDHGIPEGVMVDGYLEPEDITSEWKEWYRSRLEQGDGD